MLRRKEKQRVIKPNIQWWLQSSSLLGCSECTRFLFWDCSFGSSMCFVWPKLRVSILQNKSQNILSAGLMRRQIDGLCLRLSAQTLMLNRKKKKEVEKTFQLRCVFLLWAVCSERQFYNRLPESFCVWR